MGRLSPRPLWVVVVAVATLLGAAVRAAPYADFVMDARTGVIYHQENSETPLHPASLTKMMTLYIAFQAIQRGEITLDTEVRIHPDAADEPPSRLGLQSGQTIRLRYLLRAAAVKSANDAATAIGYAIGGSEEAFAARMNATAQAMGMTGTHFINMNGLTEQGHYSTARDMSILGRHLIYDFPQYYNLFSRRTADAGMAEVANTNRRFLDSYEGADGIKTGYTVAAGYNLTASAQRGEVRIIATVFGGTSTANRNARVAELLDVGFAAAPRHATAAYDAPTAEAPVPPTALASSGPLPTSSPRELGGHVVRPTGLVEVAVRPPARPGTAADAPTTLADAAAAAPAEAIAGALAEALAAGEGGDADAPAEIIMTAEAIAPEAAPEVAGEAEVVTRVSTSGGHHWGVNLGRYPSRDSAERELIRIALAESASLDGGLRRVIQRSGGWDANIMGLSREQADLACARLSAAGTVCFMIGAEEG